MFWPYWLSYFAVIAVTSNTGLKLVTPKKCEIEEKHGVFYSPKASHLYGKIIKSYNSINETECRRICCGLWNCTLYMYSTIVLDVSCFLIFCENKSLCLTKPLPKNASGISVVGIKQDDFPNLRTFNSSGKNLTVKQFKMHSSLPNSMLLHGSPSISTTFHHISSVKGTTTLKAMVGQLANHYGRSYVIPSSTTNQSGHITSLYHVLSIVQKRPVHLISYHVESQQLITQLHSSSLDNSLAQETRSTIDILHIFPQVSTNSSAMSLKVMNLEIFLHSKIHLVSSSSHLPFANPNIIPSISRTVIPNTHTESLGLHPNTVLSQSSGKLRDLNSSPPLPNVLHASTSPVKQNSKRKFSENHSHTTPVSLVIALIIGVLFFGTVAFLIGRRWSESCFRRGYSRVDYLLNDYD